MSAPGVRAQHLWARALLRALLCHVGGHAPADWEVERGALDAPVVRGPLALRVSVTHTRGGVACAVSAEGPVGVDMEAWSRPVRVESVASQALSPREVDVLSALPDDGTRRRALLRTWTVKEAYAKALGLGLTFSVRRFSVDLSVNPAALVLPADVPGAQLRWTVWEPGMGESHAVAVCSAATEGAALRVWPADTLLGLPFGGA